jgi:hypothetical protein
MVAFRTIGAHTTAATVATNDLTRLEQELEERRSRGEYITPMSRVQFAIGRRDVSVRSSQVSMNERPDR